MILLRDLMQNRWIALLDGLRTWPDSQVWLVCVAVMILYGFFARWFGGRRGILRKTETPLTPQQHVLLFARIILHPAFIEESLYRGLLLPPPSPGPPEPGILFWYGLSLLLYVLAHPVNAWLFRRRAQHIFTKPSFLLLVTLFGVCASLMYGLSGSLWPPILFHGVVVYAWLTIYGGLAALNRSA